MKNITNHLGAVLTTLVAIALCIAVISVAVAPSLSGFFGDTVEKETSIAYSMLNTIKSPSLAQSGATPEEAPKTGDIVYYGDYQYIYNYAPQTEGGVDVNNPYDRWAVNEEQNGWGVRCIVGPTTEEINSSSPNFDGTVVPLPSGGLSEYGAIKDYINGAPVVNADYLFYQCTNLTTCPEIPETITELNWTFYGCKASGTVEIPSAVKSIASTFMYATNLATIDIHGWNDLSTINAPFAFFSSGVKTLIVSDAVYNAVVADQSVLVNMFSWFGEVPNAVTFDLVNDATGTTTTITIPAQ